MSLVLMLSLMMGCANSGKAERLAHDYAEEFHPNALVTAIRCERGDGDGDGRVRCNVGLRSSGLESVEYVECPSGWLWQPLKTTCVGVKGTVR